jgi:E3 Ubiquitin ligase
VLVGGIVLLVVAAGAFLFARSQRARQRSFAGTERTGCGDLAQLAQSVSAEAGQGSFRQICEVSGKAQPGPSGPLTAPISGQPCVWYRATITHRSWRNVQTGSGEHRRTERREENDVVSDEISQSPLLVDDSTGQVLVDPREADIDGPEESFDRFEPHTGDEHGGTEISAFGITVRTGSDGGTLGFHRREQVIRPGRVLYVLGEARDASGTLELGKPSEKGRFLISSRSEEELTASAGKTASIAQTVAAVPGVAGVALIVVGTLA